jgi:uncharacterized protein (DUF302 family)
MEPVSLLVGLVLGIVLTGVAVVVMMPKMMIKVYPSKYGVDETAAAVEKAALDKNWKVPKIYDIQKTLADAGHKDMTPLKIVSICQPHHAYNILKPNDRDKMVSAIMPCRVGVFQGNDGKTYIAEMNMGLMSSLFGGNIAKVMGVVAKEEAEMIEPLIAK